jgi:hypothetical protein
MSDLVVIGRRESSRIRRMIGLLSHCIRLMGIFKPDCLSALQRKEPQRSPSRWRRTFSESGFTAKDAKLRAFPPIFRGMPPGFSAIETVWRREVDSNFKSTFKLSAKAPGASHLPACHPICGLKVPSFGLSWSRFRSERSTKLRSTHYLLKNNLVSLSVNAPCTLRDVVEQVSKQAQIPIEVLSDELGTPSLIRGWGCVRPRTGR